MVTFGRAVVVDELLNSPLLMSMGFTSLNHIIRPSCRKNLQILGLKLRVMQVIGFMGPSVRSGVYSGDAVRRFEGGSGGGEQEKARNAPLAWGERAADLPDRARAGAGRSQAPGRRRADAGRAVHHRPAERAQQVPFVAAYFVPGCGGRSSRARGGGGRRWRHHDPRSAGWGPAGGRLDARVYAVTDEEMDEIWGLVGEGTPIWIGE